LLIPLQEDRSLTVILLLESLSRSSKRYLVEFIANAVALTEAPSDLISYLLQQRRWVNSTFENNSRLLRTIVMRAVCCVGCRQFFGIAVQLMWLSLEQSASFFSPSLSLLMIGSIMYDVGLPSWAVICLTTLLFFSFLLVVLVFDNPGRLRPESSLPYHFAVWMSGVPMVILMVIWVVFSIISIVNPERYESASGLAALRTASLWIVFIFYIVVVLAHNKMGRLIGTFHSVFVYMAFIPFQFVLIPLFSFWHLDNFSWGNRDASDKSTAKEAFEASMVKRHTFFAFVMSNAFLFIVGRLVFEPVIVSESFSNICVSMFILLLMIGMGSVAVFSIMNAVRKCIIGRGSCGTRRRRRGPESV
jgi:cellulose synthase/poly-beta-1,6-N-acetylglucosamine synthase-like glycosyltransferase